MKCSNCGQYVPEGEKFCESCGSKIENNNSETKHCSNCGELLKSGSEFCSSCGSPVNKQNSSNNVSSDNNGGKFCINCGSKIDFNAEICPKCGVRQNIASLNKSTKHCTNCGSEIDIKAEICPRCGVRQISSTSASSDKSKAIALVLSFILPGLGHFYLGLSKKGIILLVMGLLTSLTWFYQIGLIYLIVWGYALYDSYKQADALLRGKMWKTGKIRFSLNLQLKYLFYPL